MGNWSLSAQGFTGDIAKIEEILAGLTSILSHPDTGTGYANFSHDGTEYRNFHAAPPAPDTITPGDQVAAAPVAADEAAGETTAPA